ncbi:hypothetical protein ShzoTeo12_53590 (plasmid) [Shinella zoogloeoides]|nr:hypothetical protein ShzoTeo12_53590 [Shinella zoogloeoides]
MDDSEPPAMDCVESEDLTDAEWAPCGALPSSKVRAPTREVNVREVVNGLLWRAELAGRQWRRPRKIRRPRQRQLTTDLEPGRQPLGHPADELCVKCREARDRGASPPPASSISVVLKAPKKKGIRASLRRWRCGQEDRSAHLAYGGLAASRPGSPGRHPDGGVPVAGRHCPAVRRWRRDPSLPRAGEAPCDRNVQAPDTSAFRGLAERPRLRPSRGVGTPQVVK